MLHTARDYLVLTYWLLAAEVKLKIEALLSAKNLYLACKGWIGRTEQVKH